MAANYPQDDWTELKPLEFMANNLYWSWNPTIQKVYRSIDETRWKTEANPLGILNSMDDTKRSKLSKDKNFLKQAKAAYNEYLSYVSLKDQQPSPNIVYFCSEYAIHESFPNYSGGLGVLAGDHVKTASDLNLPFIAIGLLYDQGFFTQTIDPKKGQLETFKLIQRDNLPLNRLKLNGEDVVIDIPVADRTVHAAVWQVNVGRVKLYLLDTKLPQNHSSDQQITDILYGGEPDHRIRQELILGVGGSRLVRELGLGPASYHMNEGHAAFCTLERLGHEIAANGLSFAEAHELIKATTIFTTHTPVPAGNEVYPKSLLLEYIGAYLEEHNIVEEQFFALGREDVKDKQDTNFAMTVYSLRMAAFTNGVSQLHGQVSRSMWQPIWSNLDSALVPIDAVTNAIHLPSWIAPEFRDLYSDYADEDAEAWVQSSENVAGWRHFDRIPDKKLWSTKRKLKRRLIRYIRAIENIKRKAGRSIYSKKEINSLLSADALTVGFARRFATYKRATLLFSDLKRLKSILSSSKRPVQFIFAGKAHFRDKPGKEFLRQVVRLCNESKIKGRVVFIEDYNMKIGRLMTQGVDVWLNNPRRPHEASGTSGMKVPVNAGLNFSILDGWWPEAYSDSFGWVIGDSKVWKNTKKQDEFDAESLYKTLEKEIIPTYYHKLGPGKWLNRVRASVRTCVPMFHFNRMLREYQNKLYGPALTQAVALADNHVVLKERAIQHKSWAAGIASFKILESFYETSPSGGICLHVKLDLKSFNKSEVAVFLWDRQKDSAASKLSALRMVSAGSKGHYRLWLGAKPPKKMCVIISPDSSWAPRPFDPESVVVLKLDS